ncbi:MAG TPA: hypothetical protein HA257_02410 [Candidatus Methanoperedenaceae archaeon]|nr:hypothetical protein [Candidatus Methanoperedenaceae archaeon]
MREDVEKIFYTGGMLIAMLVALMAVVKLYSSLDAIIAVWFESRYQPIYYALLNLGVLAVTVYIIFRFLLKKQS